MVMFQEDRSVHYPRWRTILFSMVLVCALGVVVSPQVQLDVCGCKNVPPPANLGDFNALTTSTYPPGTTSPDATTMDIPLPPDGVMVFKSINLVERPPYVGGYGLRVRFVRNAGNTPVTLLVSGNVTIGQYVTITLSGNDVVGANTNQLGIGSLGGPGGFRGGDGGYQLVNFARRGGAGSGPGGGVGGNDYYYTFSSGAGGANATFVGAPDLLPLIGGAGGGGGASTCTSPGAAGGGGGGGGGALLIAADGTITINGQITANGAPGGGFGDGSCSSYGGGGAGGAVRLLATTLSGTGYVYAQGGGGGSGPVGNGSIRMEALNNNMTVGQTSPLATRAAGPGPVVNPVTPTVAITKVGTKDVPSPPGGGAGAIDLVLSAPGQTAIDLSTSGVPTGTTVNVTVKPRVGGLPVTTPVTLSTCDTNGTCLASVTLNLVAGAYFVEARATFATP